MAAEQYLQVMRDGTVKQTNPFTGTQVWTVAGRGHRPLGNALPDPVPLDPARHDASCAFCPARYLETPPEKARWVRDPGWRYLEGVPAAELTASVAEFRRIPNLFEILTYEYWHDNYGFELDDEIEARRRRYLATAAGREHVESVVRGKLAASGWSAERLAATSADELLDHASGFFGGGHDVIVARRHYVDGATTTAQLASAGTLTLDEHRVYIAFTVDAARRLLEHNPYARYVAVFQNWLKPAGASFDHLHKQLVAIDERGQRNDETLAVALQHPNIFNEAGPNFAAYHRLTIAETPHAVAFAGFGHRYPTIEIYSRSAVATPWEQSPEERDQMADLLWAMHAATGAQVPCNEEWHYQPKDVLTPMPWRINLKWRVSTLAGFEGATKIYLNTIAPADLRERVVDRLEQLRDDGALDGLVGLKLGDECSKEPNPLRYVG